MAGVQQVEAAAGRDDGAAGGTDAGDQLLGRLDEGAGRGEGRPTRTDAAPPAATKALAAATAPATASDGSAPSASSPAAVEANRSPAPHGSGHGTSGAGTTDGAPSPLTSRAPRPDSVTDTAVADQRVASSRARAVVAVSSGPS